jgi:hypothetical protein
MTNEIFKDVASTAQIAFYKISTPPEEFLVDTQWFEWASELLKAGYVSPSITKLAQKEEIGDIGEQIRLLGLVNIIFEELGINLNETDNIYWHYGIYIINTREEWDWTLYDTLLHLADLYYLTQSVLFYDFPDLCWAYKELKEEGEQIIWQGITWNNKDDYVITYFHRWIKNPKSLRLEALSKETPIRKAAEGIFTSSTAYIIYVIAAIALFFLLYWLFFKFSSGILTKMIVSIFFVSALLTGILKGVDEMKRWRKYK